MSPPDDTTVSPVPVPCDHCLGCRPKAAGGGSVHRIGYPVQRTSGGDGLWTALAVTFQRLPRPLPDWSDHARRLSHP
jgi:hypothetical protein